LCRYSIDGLDQKLRREAGGADSLQALLMALKMLAADLENIRDEDFGGLLRWSISDRSGDLGLST
jgi:hypothetical protein